MNRTTKFMTTAVAVTAFLALSCTGDDGTTLSDDSWQPPVQLSPTTPGATTTYCMEDQVEITNGTNAVPLNCTANDVRLAATVLPVGTVVECTKGEVIPGDINLQGELIAGANERWDIGIWLALDGGDALRGGGNGAPLNASCNHYFLEPELSTDAYVGPDPRGPAANGQDFFDGEAGRGDTCGDLEQGVLNVLSPITLSGIVCKDDDNDGFLDIGSCVAWDNNRNTTCNAASSVTNTLPNTKSKCRCEPINVPIVVKEKGYIEVVKDLVPPTDPGQFMLYIDFGTADETAAGPGGDGLTTGKTMVSAGTQVDPGADHEVFEDFYTGTNPDFYDTSYECVYRGTATVVASGTGVGPATVHVMPEDDIVCTFTNEVKPAYLTLEKTVINDDGGTAVADDFQAYIDGSPVPWGVAQELEGGSYTASEDVVAGYAAGDWGGDCAADGSVSLDPGDNKTCTITNDDQPAGLTLEKLVDNDWGGTAVADDFQAYIDGAPVDWFITYPLPAGSHTASEDLVPGYTAGPWAGDCAADGTVTLELGTSYVCYITNSDKPARLTLEKIVINDDGGTAVPTDWELCITENGFSVCADGLNGPVDLYAATFTMTESGPSGYAASAWSCVGDGTQVGDQITLGIDEEAVCSIVNDDQPSYLEVIKYVVPPEDPGLFNLLVDGTPYASDVGDGGTTGDVGVTPGVTHTVSETAGTGNNLAFYTTEIGGDCASDGTVMVPLGEKRTCTITNTRLYPPGVTVTKTASTYLTRTWDWTILKEALNAPTGPLQQGQPYNLDYQISVEVAPGYPVDSEHKVMGTITITNDGTAGSPFIATITEVGDVLEANTTEIDAVITSCSEILPADLGPGDSMTCDYESMDAALADHEMWVNTGNAEVHWNDGSTENPFGQASADFSAATINEVDECVDVEDLTYPGQFPSEVVCEDQSPWTSSTYTVVLDGALPDVPLECGENLIENIAQITTNDLLIVDQSVVSVPVFVDCDPGCTLTQGFWKTHSALGPAPYDMEGWGNLGDFDGDTVEEEHGESLYGVGTWYEIFWTPVRGRPWYSIAHQFMAAYLNVQNGAAPGDLGTALDDAMAWLASHDAEDRNRDLEPEDRAMASSLIGILGDFNEGMIGPGHCDEDYTSAQ